MKNIYCEYNLTRSEIACKDGLRYWKTCEEKAGYNSAETALVLVDVWDRHWSKGAAGRCGVLAEKINETVVRARAKGILVVHAPSDTMDFYAESEARKRFLSVEPPKNIPEPVVLPEYPQPVDSSDGGGDTQDDYPPDTIVWTRQSEKIFIDESADLVCGDEGDRLYAHFKSRGIKFIIYAGVHTNMCILHRSFAIKKMVRRGFKTALIRDLTDAMYNPEKAPYVSHDEGTALVISYIEKFYSPTITSGQI